MSWLLFLFLAVPSPASAGAGESAPPGRLRLFVDCPATACDFDDLRRRIDVVDWVRDRADADVYVLVTERTTTSGGLERTLFVMRASGSPAADTLRWFHPVASSDWEIRDALTRALQAVLARDLIGRPEGRKLRWASSDAPSGAPDRPETAATATADPWNAWVFQLSVDGTFDGQRAYRSAIMNGGMSASRVTKAWKLGAGWSGSYNENRFEYSDGSSFTSIARGWSASVRSVRSISGRWSAGARGFASSSSYANLHLETGAGPALEFDVFPYDESSRRSIALAYEITARRSVYDEITLYGKSSETLWRESVEARVALVQPWGSVSLGTTFSHYLHDATKYRAGVSGTIGLQLARGLSISLNGIGLRVRDQLSLRRGDASDEEILTRIREIDTAYQYNATVGVTYTFGSILNGIVNERLDQVYGP